MSNTIKFQPNVTYEVTLAYDEPKTGEGANGPWILYGCEEDTSFFATGRLHATIQGAGAKKGTTLHIFKEQQKSPHRVWIGGNEIFPPSPTAGLPLSSLPPAVQVNGNGNGNGHANGNGNGNGHKQPPAPSPSPAPAPTTSLAEDTLVVLAARLRVAQALARTPDSVDREATQNTVLIELNKKNYVAPDHILGAAHQHLVEQGILQATTPGQSSQPPGPAPPLPQLAPVSGDNEDLPF